MNGMAFPPFELDSSERITTQPAGLADPLEAAVKAFAQQGHGELQDPVHSQSAVWGSIYRAKVVFPTVPTPSLVTCWRKPGKNPEMVIKQAD